MPNAARMADAVKQISPHCHAPIHPAAPVPTPVPHSPLPLKITGSTAMSVLINNRPAATLTSTTEICMLPSCVPAGPGVIAQGSSTVFIEGLPAARKGDLTAHSTCVAPIPGPAGKIIEGSANVIIGG